MVEKNRETAVKKGQVLGVKPPEKEKAVILDPDLAAFDAKFPESKQRLEANIAARKELFESLEKQYNLFRKLLDDQKKDIEFAQERNFINFEEAQQRWNSLQPAVNLVSDIREEMSNIIEGIGMDTAETAPQTITLGEGENAVEFQENELQEILQDPARLQGVAKSLIEAGANQASEELAQMAADQFREGVAQEQVVTPQGEPTEAELAAGTRTAVAGPLGVGGSPSAVENIRRNISQVLSGFGGGQRPDAREQVERTSAAFKRESRKPIGSLS